MEYQIGKFIYAKRKIGKKLLPRGIWGTAQMGAIHPPARCNKSFRNACHDQHKELAPAIMQYDNQNMNEVAVLPGYAGYTGFRRAFKHWVM